MASLPSNLGKKASTNLGAIQSFFHALAPGLVANISTVVFVYSFVKISRKERSREEEGRGTYLWLILLVFFFMLYGIYTWDI